MDASPISLALVRKLAASADAVYSAWTEPKRLARWLAPRHCSVSAVTNDPRKGGHYRIDGVDGNGAEYSISGTYLDLEAGRRIVMSWVYNGPAVALRGDESLIVAELRELGPSQTELTLTHEKLFKRRAADLNRQNWISCLQKLSDTVDTSSAPNSTQSIVPAQAVARSNGFYRDEHREWQDRFETRALADRLKDINVKRMFDPSDAAFIAHQNMFILSTVDSSGQPSCSYKGGKRGFVHVIDEKTLAFPNYDGSGMYLSIGNISKTARIAMLFLDFERQSRLRVTGTASIHENDRLLELYPGAELMVRVKAHTVFANCPRYIHKMQMVEESVFVPEKNGSPPDAEWKRLADFSDVLPEKDVHLSGNEIDTARALNRD